MRLKHIIVLFLLGAAVFAQTALIGNHYALIPLGTGGAFPEMLEKPNRVCGYFVLVGGTVDPPDGRTPLVYLRYSESEDIPDSMIMGRDKFVTVVDNTRRVPLVTLSKAEGDTRAFYWLLRLSQKDWQSGRPCIPDPSDPPAEPVHAKQNRLP